MTLLPDRAAAEAEPFLRRRGDGSRRPAVLRDLSTADAGAVLRLHALTRAQLPPGVVAEDSPGFVEARLGPEGLGFGVWVEEDLVAYALLGLPSRPGGEIGPHLGLGDRPVAELDGAGVHPDWQGNGLHARLTALRLGAARRSGRDDVVATASPENPFSLSTLFGAGLRARALVRMPHGASRLVLHRALSIPEPPPVPAEQIVWFTGLDGVSLEARLADGWEGCAARPGPAGPEIGLRRPG